MIKKDNTPKTSPTTVYDDCQIQSVNVFDIAGHMFGTNLRRKIDANPDYFPKLLEDYLYFFDGVNNAFNSGLNPIPLIVRETINLIKARTGKSLHYHLNNNGRYVFECAKDGLIFCVREIIDQATEMMSRAAQVPQERYPEGHLQVQGIDIMEANTKLRNLFDNYDDFKKTKLCAKVTRLCSYLITNNIFDCFGLNLDTLGYNAFQQKVMLEKFQMGPSFAICCLDIMTFVVEKGIIVAQTGDINCVMHSSKAYSGYYSKYKELTIKARQLHNPEAFGFRRCDFIIDLENLLDKFENVRKYIKDLDSYDIRIVDNIIGELSLMRTNYITKDAAQRHRPAPFAVCIYGDSGIGKSYITKMLFTVFGRNNKLDVGTEYMYSKNSAAKFWDGFKTSHWCLVLDDVADRKPSSCPAGDESLTEIIKVINNVPYTPDQAALEDKGRIPMQCKLAIATTNVKHLNTYHYFATPGAVQRRLPYIITPKVLPGLHKEGGQLDGSKLNHEDGHFTDAWSWTVEQVIPQPIASNKKMSDFKIILKDATLKEFLTWYNSAIDEHNRNQHRAMHATDDMSNVVCCTACNLPSYMCDCPTVETEVQGSDDYVFFSAPFWMILFGWVLGTQANAMFTLLRWFLIKTYILRKLGLVTAGVERRRRCLVRRINHRFQHDYDYFADLGLQVQDTIGPRKLFASIGFALGVLTSLKVFRRVSVQGYTSQSIGKRIEASDKEERQNVWYNDNIEMSPLDVTPQNRSSIGVDLGTFIQNVSRDVVSFSTSLPCGKGVKRGNGVCLRGFVYMTNNHMIPEILDHTTITISDQPEHGGVNRNVTLKLSNSQVIRRPATDTCYLLLRGLPPKRGIFNYIPEKFESRANGQMISRNKDGSITQRNLECMLHEPNAQVKDGDFDVRCPLYSASTSIPTEGGDCGSLVIADTPKGKLAVGFHVGLQRSAFTNKVLSIAFNKAECKTILLDHPNFTIQAGYSQLSAPGYSQDFANLHNKSCIRYIEEGSAAVHGTVVGFRQQPRTQVCATPMRKHLAEFGYEPHFVAPQMNGYLPWRNAMIHLVKPTSMIDNDILEMAKASFIEDIKSNLNTSCFKNLGVLDDITTVNGAPGVAYIDKMNRNTSAGFPWHKGKLHFMSEIAAPRSGLHYVELDKDIIDRANQTCENYLDGIRSHPVFTASLKDEPVSLKKREKGETRVFTGAPVDNSFVARKYLLTFIKMVQENKYVFESAPGTVCQSTEWEQIYQYLTELGSTRIIAGDYSKFDKQMSPLVMMAAFDIIIEILIWSGQYTSDDIMIVRGIAADTSYPLVYFNGDLVQLYGSNPSGHSLTVIINGLCNCLLMRMAYIMLNPKKESHSFRLNTRLMTYGDDNVCGVGADAPWFNHTSIVEAFASLGIKYTMADKEAESVPYINIYDASFLKRTWRWDFRLKCHMAVLEEASIEKSLTTWVRSKAIAEEEQAIAVIDSAMREYFFYGEGIFKEKQRMFRKIIVAMNLETWALSFPNLFTSYESMCERFWENSKHIKLKKKPKRGPTAKSRPGVPVLITSKLIEVQSASLFISIDS